MKLFGKKRAEGLGASRTTTDAEAPISVSHRLTLDLSRAMEMASMLACSRASQFIEIPDFLAGVYLYEWDRISEYWPEESRDGVEETLRDICQISPQRWNYWIQLYDKRRQDGEPQSNWEKLTKPRPELPDAEPPIPSATFRNVLEAAERLTPYRDPRHKAEHSEGEDFFDQGVPVLTTECVLLSVVKYTSSDSGRRLAESGLDVEMLERATLDPKRSPIR
jgi:hypothetical protein